MANRYWVGGSGLWDDTSHWSLNSGGVGGASVPDSSSDVIVDSNSFSANGQKITISETDDYQEIYAKSFDCSSTTYNFLFEPGSAGSFGTYVVFNLYGDLTLSSKMAIPPSGYVTFSIVEACVFAQNGANLSPTGQRSMFTLDRIGSALDLASDAVVNSLSVISGTFRSNGYSLSTGGIDSYSFASRPRTIDIRDSTVTMFNAVTNSDNVQLSDTGLNLLTEGSLVVLSASNRGFNSGNYYFEHVRITANGVSLSGDNSFGTLDVRSSIEIAAGSTQTVAALSLTGASSSKISLRSSTSGTKFNISRATGVNTINYADIKDSNATGGATWNAYYSTDSGNNTGWSVIGIPKIYPNSVASAEAFGSPTFSLGPGFMSLVGIASAEAFGSPTLKLKIYPTSVSSAEAFGTPTLTAAITGIGGIASGEVVSAVSFTTLFFNPTGIASAEAFGLPKIKMTAGTFGGIATAEAFGTPTITQSPPPPPPDTDWSALGKEDEKVYVYKVYDASGNYIGVWSDVKDDPMWTQRINTPGTTTTVILARSPNTTKESRDVLVTQDGEAITTEDGQDLVTVYESPNTVGEGSDVELNYRVDIYVHYGGFEVLTTQDGEPITTEDGEELLVASGAPLGVRVFSGYIMDYESVYGEEAGVTVTLASNGHELANEIVRTGETTTVSYSGTALETILKSVLDTNPGRMTYDAASIQSTGVSPTLKFQLNTKLEAVDSIFNQTPDGWYWYGNVGENLLYLKPVSTVYDHTFILGRHIKSLKVRRSIESIKNTVYFVGGETTEGNPATTKYKKYVDSTSLSQWRTGIERITDRRYIVDASMERRAQKVLTSYAQPIFTSPLVISAARYDIESIKLGQTVGFSGFGNFIDALPPLQIVSYSYASTEVTLELGQVQERQVDTLSKTESQLNIEQYSTIPTVPS